MNAKLGSLEGAVGNREPEQEQKEDLARVTISSETSEAPGRNRQGDF